MNMAITDESAGNGFYMPVAPAYGGNGGMFDGNNGWWIILLLLCGWGGFGGFGMGGYGAMMGGMYGGWELYPWLNNSQHISDGFRDQMLQTSISSVGDKLTSGFGDLQTSLCSGFAGVNATVNGAANSLSQQMNANQLAALERSFAAQTAAAQGFNGVQAGISDLRYTEATEACATRTASANNTRDIIDAQTRGTQAILDKLCALELDGVKAQLAAAQRENLGLQNQVNMAAMRESQTAQTAQILAGQAAEIDGVYNRLKNCPVGTYSVCNPLAAPNYGCGCGCGA